MKPTAVSSTHDTIAPKAFQEQYQSSCYEKQISNYIPRSTSYTVGRRENGVFL